MSLSKNQETWNPHYKTFFSFVTDAVESNKLDGINKNENKRGVDIIKVFSSSPINKKAIFTTNKEMSMRLRHPPYGSTSPKYKLLCFTTTKKISQREERTSF